ncbi:PAS domain-containing sensor histidine kinase [Hymenobacter arizonensis]|uniref:histidine kinase n=1 Tax=Hymenobacter arizonensis TaxID=1227077 RepID=A0A1I6BHD3_HYMAR|nr:PAS domain-containing sensor histidine kinase [Hymenobacter arizonensis]SFQ80301.1 two-component system, OmpR family, sensor histidine kinase VicK [Hymenobacter arizonensis]
MSDFAALLMEQAEASPHVQFIYDAATARVVFVNPAYEHVLGGTPGQVNEELPALLARLHPDDRPYLAKCWRLWTRGQLSDEVEVRLLVANEPDQWFCLTPFCQQKGTAPALLAGMLRDITVSKHYQQNTDTFLARKNAMLEILSHDLSGGFALVQQIAEYLREEVQAPADSQLHKMLGVLETTSRGSLKMIRDLVDIEFLSSANTDLKRERVEVGAVLRETLEQLQQGQRVLGFRLDYSLPREPVYAHLDVNKFQQVLNNLVSNAFKFTPDGGRVEVEVAACPGGVQVHVRDTGIGIPAALQPVLFERFTKARRPGLRGEPTTGLGLVLCKTITEWHRGTLSFVSTEGQGSTFTVEIPQAV